MNASGLVYAAIVLMWGAVLIPMWLRRHDATSENRSAERFGQAMRVLSRREGSADQREIVVPARPRESTGPVTTATTRPARPVVSPPVTSARPTPDARRGAAVRSPRSEARAALARRRARTLAVLGAVAVLLGLLAVVSVLPAWAPLPAALLLVGFVVHLRTQARRAAQRRRHRPVPASSGRPSSARPSADDRAERSARSRALVVETKGEPASATTDRATASDQEAQPVADGDPSWQPNPLPLPTYVTAPKAVRPIRVIDLTTPGAWTSGRLLDDEIPVVEEALADAAADAAELDALLEQDVAHDAASRPAAPRRAVGD